MESAQLVSRGRGVVGAVVGSPRYFSALHQAFFCNFLKVIASISSLSEVGLPIDSLLCTTVIPDLIYFSSEVFRSVKKGKKKNAIKCIPRISRFPEFWYQSFFRERIRLIDAFLNISPKGHFQHCIMSTFTFDTFNPQRAICINYSWIWKEKVLNVILDE